jgi:2-dehydro-3-deoxygluconokinase
MIHLKEGERSFSYWRSGAAAKLLADDGDALRVAIDAANAVFLSGITLAILAPSAVGTLIDEFAKAKARGTTVVFDPNIRPGLWNDPETMCSAISAGARAANLVMPSFDDETAHFGDRSIAETIARYRGLGAEQVVAKNGAEGIPLSLDLDFQIID